MVMHGYKILISTHYFQKAIFGVSPTCVSFTVLGVCLALPVGLHQVKRNGLTSRL